MIEIGAGNFDFGAGGVLAHLLRVARAWNGDADRRMGETKCQGSLHVARYFAMHQEAQPLGLRQLASKGFAFETASAHIFALKALLIGGGQFTGKNSSPERHAGDDTDIGLLCQRKHFLGRLLGQQIVFDLDQFPRARP